MDSVQPSNQQQGRRRQSHAEKSIRKRRKGLKKKTYELATLCDADIAMVCYGPSGGEPMTWPENPSAVEATFKRFFDLSKDKQEKNRLHLSDFVIEEEEKKKKKKKTKKLSSVSEDKVEGETQVPSSSSLGSKDRLNQSNFVLLEEEEEEKKKLHYMREDDEVKDEAQVPCSTSLGSKEQEVRSVQETICREVWHPHLDECSEEVLRELRAHLQKKQEMVRERIAMISSNTAAEGTATSMAVEPDVVVDDDESNCLQMVPVPVPLALPPPPPPPPAADSETCSR